MLHNKENLDWKMMVHMMMWLQVLHPQLAGFAERNFGVEPAAGHWTLGATAHKPARAEGHSVAGKARLEVSLMSSECMIGSAAVVNPWIRSDAVR